MDLALPAPLQTLPLGAGLFAVIKAAFAALTRDDLTAEQHAQAARVREVIDTFGSYVLEAENREDLLVRVDTLIGDPEFHHAFSEVYDTQWATADVLGEMPSVTPPGEDYHAAFCKALGPAALPHLRKLHQSMLWLIRFLQELQEQATQAGEKPAEAAREEPGEAPPEREDPLFFLSDPAVPIAFGRGMLGAMRCWAFTIAAWAATVHPVEGWLGLALAERWSEEAGEVLALFASLFEENTARALDGRAKAIREAYARFNADAERSGDPVYPSAS